MHFHGEDNKQAMACGDDQFLHYSNVFMLRLQKLDYPGGCASTGTKCTLR
jgi:hypothetical protein